MANAHYTMRSVSHRVVCCAHLVTHDMANFFEVISNRFFHIAWNASKMWKIQPHIAHIMLLLKFGCCCYCGIRFVSFLSFEESENTSVKFNRCCAVMVYMYLPHPLKLEWKKTVSAFWRPVSLRLIFSHRCSEAFCTPAESPTRLLAFLVGYKNGVASYDRR